MKVHEVVQRAIRDPLFAAELAGKASAASQHFTSDRTRIGESGGPWESLLREFAESPEELARLMSPEKLNERGTTWTTATTTTVTTSTCTATTVTVATTIL